MKNVCGLGAVATGELDVQRVDSNFQLSRGQTGDDGLRNEDAPVAIIGQEPTAKAESIHLWAERHRSGSQLLQVQDSGAAVGVLQRVVEICPQHLRTGQWR